MMSFRGFVRRLIGGGDTDPFESGYFANLPWLERLRVARDGLDNEPFAAASVEVIEQLVTDLDFGARMVVNITADALLSFLDSGEYKNLYEEPVIGGKPRRPSDERRAVDALLGFDDPSAYYFGAVALAGAGVRFYGEYCMVMRPDTLGSDTRLFDRDSYDLLLPPLRETAPRLARRLAGKWSADLAAMLALKVLPRLRGHHRIATAGAIADAILHDQDFVEVHKRGAIRREGIEEIRLSPDDYAGESHDLLMQLKGELPASAWMLWSERRNRVLSRLRELGIPTRVVTGREVGYQWK